MKSGVFVLVLSTLLGFSAWAQLSTAAFADTASIPEETNKKLWHSLYNSARQLSDRLYDDYEEYYNVYLEKNEPFVQVGPDEYTTRVFLTYQNSDADSEVRGPYDVTLNCRNPYLACEVYFSIPAAE